MPRLMLCLLLLGLLLPALLAPAVAQAQEPAAPAVSIPPDLPPEVRLQGLKMMWQQYNRCSPTALYIQLSYFNYAGSATDIIRWLNPYNEDKSVRLEELIAFAETQGLRGIARTGGSFELMQRVLAAGFPILVENAYWHRNDNNDWMSHNRIMMGYDSGSFYFYDPLLGPGDDQNGYGIRYEEFDRRWRDFNRNFMILYHPEQEAELQAALGEHWDPQANARFTLAQAQAETESQQDMFSYYNLGAAHLALGEIEAASAAFDRARAMGMPWRMHWYRFEMMEAYLAAGRYDDVIALVYEVLENADEIQEAYYYIGKAYEGQGNIERARANYFAALARNANYPEAQAAIDALAGQ